MISLEYVWIGGNNELRSKTRIVDKFEPATVNELPMWNYDGSSTNQAIGNDSEVLIKPRKCYQNPFSTNPFHCGYLILCDTWLPNGEPHPTNTRVNAEKIFDLKKEEKPWFGMEQEFFVFNLNSNLPLGFPAFGFPSPQGPYYCSVGSEVCYGRSFLEEAEKNCIIANIGLTGKNFEVCPGQMEMQVKNEGIDAADDMIMLRYILKRTAEKFFYKIDFNAKPVKGDWNGSGCHTNFSTLTMRKENGYDTILSAIDKLSKKHKEHIEVYGSGNEERLTGLHETAHIDKFTYGVANRGASVRIPRDTEKNKCGYFEDRRPSSECDPYLVTSKIFETCCL